MRIPPPGRPSDGVAPAKGAPTTWTADISLEKRRLSPTEYIIPEMVCRPSKAELASTPSFWLQRVGFRHFAACVSDGSVHAAMGVGLGVYTRAAALWLVAPADP